MSGPALATGSGRAALPRRDPEALCGVRQGRQSCRVSREVQADLEPGVGKRGEEAGPHCAQQAVSEVWDQPPLRRW